MTAKMKSVFGMGMRVGPGPEPEARTADAPAAQGVPRLPELPARVVGKYFHGSSQVSTRMWVW